MLSTISILFEKGAAKTPPEKRDQTPKQAQKYRAASSNVTRRESSVQLPETSAARSVTKPTVVGAASSQPSLPIVV